MKQAKVNEMNKFKYVLILLLFILPVMDGFAAIPLVLNYQGNVKDGTGAPINGLAYFKFAIVNQAGDTAYWVNGGTTLDGSEPPSSVSITVSDGVFSVKLGDTSLTNMAALTESVFDNDQIYLRVWFSTDNVNFEQFASDIQIVSTGFAFKAAVADTVKDSSVTSVTIQDNSITNADINNSAGISASKINRTDLNADLLDGLDSTDFAKTTDLTWGNIANIPAGFADGIDNDSGGDITAVIAGSGLTGGGTSGSVTLSANTSVVQARVTGSCPSGQSISAISSTGTVTCQVIPDPNSGTTSGCGTSCAATTTGSTATVNIQSVTVQATASTGRILVFFNGLVECNAAAATDYVYLYTQITTTSTTAPVGYLDGGTTVRGQFGGTGYFDYPVSVHRSFAISSAGTYTYYVNAKNFSTAAIGCKYYAGNIDAIYIP